MKTTRRESFSVLGTAAALPWLGALSLDAEARGIQAPHIASNTYPWLTFANRAGAPFELHNDELLSQIAQTGIAGYEPIIMNTSEFQGLGDRLRKHGLEMRSLYVNSSLHDAPSARQSIREVLAIAEAARGLGTKIIVTNPSPIRWGSPEDKTDAQLDVQAKALDYLGAELRQLGLMLAYHNHDAELRQGAREFHHMLTATDPENVKLCLDAHWVFRGCGDSQVALFDALSHYHARIVELHVRQSIGGVWSEAFTCAGDIDYARLFNFLKAHQLAPHLVLEQAVEEKSPSSLGTVEAHRQSRENLAQAWTSSASSS